MKLTGTLNASVCTEVASLLSGQSLGEKKWKCENGELFEIMLVYFVPHYSRKRFFRRGFDPEL